MTYGFTEGEAPFRGIKPGVADGQCTDGALIIREIRSEGYPSVLFGEGNHQVYDFRLFHMNIRANAVARTEAFLSQQRAQAPVAADGGPAESGELIRVDAPTDVGVPASGSEP